MPDAPLTDEGERFDGIQGGAAGLVFGGQAFKKELLEEIHGGWQDHHGEELRESDGAVAKGYVEDDFTAVCGSRRVDGG